MFPSTRKIEDLARSPRKAAFSPPIDGGGLEAEEGAVRSERIRQEVDEAVRSRPHVAELSVA